jgi:hypothetical protein
MQVAAAYPQVEAGAWETFEQLGVFSEAEVVPAGTATTLDAFCHLFEKTCQFAEGEKDMIAMQHQFEVELPDGSTQKLTSTLVDFGQQPSGYSSMARTVCLPLAIAVEAILLGRFDSALGVQVGVCYSAVRVPLTTRSVCRWECAIVQSECLSLRARCAGGSVL